MVLVPDVRGVDLNQGIVSARASAAQQAARRGGRVSRPMWGRVRLPHEQERLRSMFRPPAETTI
jgi:hypothetical protein